MVGFTIGDVSEVGFCSGLDTGVVNWELAGEFETELKRSLAGELD